MKTMKKLLALALVLVMLTALSASALAATVNSGNGGPASITITLPTKEVVPSQSTEYKIYKVFDATTGSNGAISYKLVSGKTTAPTGFSVDAAGNVSYSGTGTSELTAADIAAIASYVTASDLVYTATVAAGDTSVTVTGLEYGYYYISTSSGTVVTVDSTNPNAEVNDKNIIPDVKKSPGTQYDENSRKAIAAVGTSQPFTAQINVGKGTKNLKFTDTMTNMTYNGDVVVTVGGSTVAPSTSTFSVSGAAGDASFTITFVDSYIAGLAAETIITINYSGTITSDALSADPATNTASITSGDKNNSSNDTVEVYNAKFTVSKQDGDGAALAGAGFVVMNSDGAYYKLNAASGSTPASITWYELAEGETLAQAIAAGKVTEYTSDATGAVTAFTGLGAGTYTLVESTTPDGYNTAADQDFEIKNDDFTSANLELTATVTNNAGTELPSTGGIGTTLFYVIGSILVIGAGVVLVSKRRVSE